MAPKFLIRKHDQKDATDADISAAEESSTEALTVNTSVGRKRRRSFLDRIPTSLNVSTDSLPDGAGETTPRTSSNEKSSTSFLLTVNNLIRSPRSAVPNSDTSLKPPVGRPRARTAPSTPCNEDVALVVAPIELPAHVPPREKVLMPQTADVPSIADRPEEKQESELWASSWFRRPQEVVTSDIQRTPTMPTPASQPDLVMQEDDISPKNQMKEPRTPQQQQRTPAGVSDHQLRAPASVGMVELSANPTIRREAPSSAPQLHPPRQRPHARSIGPIPPPGRPFIPMPSWPVTGTPNALLGPIPPGAGPAPPSYAHFPRVPFFAPNRSNSMPTPPAHTSPKPASLPTPPPPPTAARNPSPAPTSRPPSPTPNQLSALRQAHTALLSNLHATHARETASLHRTIAEQRNALDAAHHELANLRTHVTLLSRAAALAPGRTLSPSGLLPVLDTSPETLLREREREREREEGRRIGSEATTVPSRAESIASFDAEERVRQASSATVATEVEVGSPSEHAELALEVENLKTVLGRREGALSEAEGEIAGLQREVDGARRELEREREEKEGVVQTLRAVERKEAQMRAALGRAGKKEMALKVKLGDLEGRLVMSNEERVDLREAWEGLIARVKEGDREREEGKGREGRLKNELKALVQKEREAREGMEKMMSEMARLRGDAVQRSKEAVRGDERGIEVVELRSVLEATKSMLDVETKRASRAETELVAEKKEVSRMRTKLNELEKQLASPVDQTGMITIANALGGEYGGISPIGPTSIVGRLHLLRSEVRHLDSDERKKLADEIRRLEGRSVYADTGCQTDKSSEEKRDKEREKAHKVMMRKLEAERDQLSGLLSTEIRRAARQSGRIDDGFQGLSRLERWDSVSSRASTIRIKPSSMSLNSADNDKHAACEELLDKARQGFEEEIKGLVKEIVLYKLDIKGYKKDLRKANNALKMLKQVSTPTSAEDRVVPESAKVEPLSLRSRASTTNLAKEQVKDPGRPGVSRIRSVDGLGITFGDHRPDNDNDEGDGEDARLARKDSGFAGKTMAVDEVSTAGPSTFTGLTPTMTNGDLQRAGTQRSIAQSIISSYGKDRNSVPPDALLDEEDLRPLSTVAEVGSA
ncbi:hypothetical protein CAC42_6953 [Sphaceloma murrayae]|uniref:Uncharacterized protein n=1 Tax=Sphaceloma murrayae TaxID=2082308 RepID=A0A2K1QQQ8_9PEZI|nr:hypothetical protein CAC42_6953 [Sphaceloma murrayae]